MKRKLFLGEWTEKLPLSDPRARGHGGRKSRNISSLLAAPSRGAATAYWQGMNVYPHTVTELDLEAETGFQVLPILKKVENV